MCQMAMQENRLAPAVGTGGGGASELGSCMERSGLWHLAAMPGWRGAKGTQGCRWKARFCRRQLPGRLAAADRSFRERAVEVRSPSGALRGAPVRMGSAARGTSRCEGKSFPAIGTVQRHESAKIKID